MQSHNSTNNTTYNNPQPITTTKTQESTNSLWKDKIIQFKCDNDNNWNTVTLVKRWGKHTGIYPNAWNVKFEDDTIKSVDLTEKSRTGKQRYLNLIQKQ